MPDSAPLPGRIVGGVFLLGRRIGAGAFGMVHLGTDIRTGEEVAVKSESLAAKSPRLLYEARVCALLNGSEGVPRVHWYGVDGEHAVMVLDLLGPSLEDLLKFCHGRFGLTTVLLLADQILCRIEQLNARGFVHRDIKPDNFLIGLQKEANTVHVIDFGLAKCFCDPLTQQRPPQVSRRAPRGLVGTAKFASLGAHNGVEQGPRDDLEAIGHMLVFFGLGRLPWQGLAASSVQQRFERIAERKASTPVEVLCQGLPGEFAVYLNYCRGLHADERPDYAYLRQLFRGAFIREGYHRDAVFDWTLKAMRLLDTEAKERCEEEREAGGAARARRRRRWRCRRWRLREGHRRHPDAVNK